MITWNRVDVFRAIDEWRRQHSGDAPSTIVVAHEGRHHIRMSAGPDYYRGFSPNEAERYLGLEIAVAEWYAPDTFKVLG